MRTNTLTVLLITIICLSFTYSKKEVVFTFKKFEKKKLGMVTPKLYAGKHEVSHMEYKEFLNYLEKSGKQEELEIAKIHNENWKSLPGHLDPIAENYHTHPAYDNYPVVNISQDAAKLFCEWITEEYHKQPKRLFKKVEFRLPTEEEWILAARAGHQMAPFPWGGYYVRNAQGQFLANFRRIGQTSLKVKTGTTDVEIVGNFEGPINKYYLTAPVDSYHPSDFGLHNMSGNVAEMLSTKGRTKGGSWYSSGYYIQIDAEDEFKGFDQPSPLIGFRYFMEVQEEF